MNLLYDVINKGARMMITIIAAATLIKYLPGTKNIVHITSSNK